MTQPLVSIITPCYNSESFIKNTIESVLHQSYKNWEMLITDDGSTDNSVKIIETFIAEDPRIKLFKISNAGAAVARNTSIKNAQGTFIAFLDSDDIWLTKKLEKQINFMLINDYSLSFTSYQRMNEEGTLINEVVKAHHKLNYKNMLSSNKIGCLTAVYNQEKIGKFYMPLIRKRQDYAFWLSILKKVDFAYGIDEVLATYRIRNFSMSSKKTEMIKWNWKLYREIEQKTLIRSIYYVLCNICIKLKNR
ncbi:glycosyltransferase family 2 protein [Wenyingzhuangia marina]|uniref:Glycosyltransferase involved in cell wall bisynthesis n=1 Tax=Wenyingzhuangia marina TaxID=1195760 RepID=A0A1M5U921_9FLAO|nr:glycosyltransferase family 2 protein [Wenyingzhuangia marina]GGF68924.1 glycosyl transferase [Wenyingzhuangia marina]SHH59484.1 Glycosyltransferase involved in cell wall bisynthesis [Wenyingzhuangia marina]